MRFAVLAFETDGVQTETDEQLNSGDTEDTEETWWTRLPVHAGLEGLNTSVFYC